jgi:hypothetical protein
VQGYRDAIVALTREAQAEETLRLEAAGTDWGEIGIGAGGATVLLLAGAGGLVAVSRRRGPVAGARA